MATLTIQKGDTLWKIAERAYGDGTRWKEIQTANKIKNAKRLKIGSTIEIPGVEDAALPEALRKRNLEIAAAAAPDVPTPGAQPANVPIPRMRPSTMEQREAHGTSAVSGKQRAHGFRLPPGDPDKDLSLAGNPSRFRQVLEAQGYANRLNIAQAFDDPPATLTPDEIETWRARKEATVQREARKEGSRVQELLKGSRYDTTAPPPSSGPDFSIADPEPPTPFSQSVQSYVRGLPPPPPGYDPKRLTELPDDAPGDDRTDRGLMQRNSEIESDRNLDWLMQDKFRPKPETAEGTTFIGDIWRAVKAEFGGSAQAAEAPGPDFDAANPDDDPLAWLMEGTGRAEPPPDKSFGEKLLSAAKNTALDVVDMPLQGLGGVRDGAQAMLDFVDWAGDELAGLAAKVGLEDPERAAELAATPGPQLPEISEPRGFGGQATRLVAEFLTGFGAAGRLGKIFGEIGMANKVGRTARFLARASVADFLAFQPDQGRLSDLLQQVPELQNPVSEYLASDPNDGEAEGRFKNAMEGLIVGPAMAGFVKALRVIKAARQLKAALPQAAAKRAVAMAKGDRLPTEPARDMLLLGSPDAPLIARQEDMAARKFTQAMGETEAGVPGDVVAKSLTNKGLTPFGNGEVYVNFARIDSAESIQQVINDAATAFKGEIGEAARGVRTHAQTKAAAEELDAFDLLMQRRTGQAFNAEQSLAARNLWVAAADKLQETARLAARGPSPENLFQFRRMTAVFHSIQKEVIGARTEIARALNAWKIPAGGSKTQMDAISKVLAESGGGDFNAKMAAKIASLNSRDALSAMVEKGVYGKTRDAVQEVWINFILSGPKTHIVNTVSNASVAGITMFEHATAARLGRLLGTEDAVQVGEAMAQWAGMRAGFLDALRNAAKTARTGETGFFSAQKYGVEGARTRAISSTAFNLRSNSFVGRAVDGVGAVVNIPGRALQTEDEFFKTIGYRMSLHQQAYRQVMKELQSGVITRDQVKDRMVSILANPSEDMSLEATAKAAYQTFTDEPGPLIAKLNGIRSQYPLTKFVIPFIQTPTNIFKYTFERTPIAPLTARYRAAIAKGGGEADLARTKMAIGTLVMMTSLDLALNGSVTGSGPVNRKEYENLRRQGWQPYSIKIGNEYISYNRMDPLGALIGYAADLGEYLANAEDIDQFGEGGFERAFAAAVFSAAEVVTSKTYMQGIADTIEAVQDPERFATNYVKNMGASLLVPNFVREVRRGMDPTQRYTTGLIDEIKSRLPGFSEELPARRDAWGREIRYQSGLGNGYDFFSPLYGSEYKPEPIDLFMQKDGWYIGTPASSFIIDGERVSLRGRPDIYSRYVEIRGNVRPAEMGEPGQRLEDRYGNRTLLEVLNDLVSGEDERSDSFNELRTSDDRESYINRIVSDYQRVARSVVFAEHPEIFDEADRLKSLKFQPGTALEYVQ